MKNTIPYYGLIEPPKAEDIKELRIQSGLTQDELASLVGLSGGIAISKYEQGIRRPSTQVWTLILLFTNHHPDLKVIKKSKKGDHQSSK